MSKYAHITVRKAVTSNKVTLEDPIKVILSGLWIVAKTGIVARDSLVLLTLHN